MNKAILALTAAALAGCGGRSVRLEDGRVPDAMEHRATRGAYIEVIGIGAADPALPTETQRRATARDAAIVKAQFELLTIVKGATLEGGVKVSRAIEIDSLLASRVNDTIRGAEVVRTEFTADHGCLVTLRLPRRRLERMMGVALP